MVNSWFPKLGVPPNGWCIRGHPSINGWFEGSPMSGNLHMVGILWYISEYMRITWISHETWRLHLGIFGTWNWAQTNHEKCKLHQQWWQGYVMRLEMIRVGEIMVLGPFTIPSALPKMMNPLSGIPSSDNTSSRAAFEPSRSFTFPAPHFSPPPVECHMPS